MTKVIPFGDRILCKRRKVGEKIGGILLAPDEMKDRPTDLADVVSIPDLSFTDKELIQNSEQIVHALTEKAKSGEAEALKSLLELNQYLKIKSVKIGDAIMIGKYVGVSFYSNESAEEFTLVRADDIIGLVIDE